MISSSKYATKIFASLALLSVISFTGCSAGSIAGVTAPPSTGTQTAVTVVPATASISTIRTQGFSATVSNSVNSAVTWQVDGVQGGDVNVGFISADGLYTPSPRIATHSITATSVEDKTKSGHASVDVTSLSGVLTYHNDNTRSGQYLRETVLKPSDVK